MLILNTILTIVVEAMINAKAGMGIGELIAFFFVLYTFVHFTTNGFMTGGLLGGLVSFFIGAFIMATVVCILEKFLGGHDLIIGIISCLVCGIFFVTDVVKLVNHDEA